MFGECIRNCVRKYACYEYRTNMSIFLYVDISVVNNRHEPTPNNLPNDSQHQNGLKTLVFPMFFDSTLNFAEREFLVF